MRYTVTFNSYFGFPITEEDIAQFTLLSNAIPFALDYSKLWNYDGMIVTVKDSESNDQIRIRDGEFSDWVFTLNSEFHHQLQFNYGKVDKDGNAFQTEDISDKLPNISIHDDSFWDE